MTLMCQKDSYLKTFQSPITSIENCKRIIEGNEISGIDLIFKDTIFFPTGGGQPCDYGKIGEKNVVVDVRRENNDAVLFLKTEESAETIDLRIGDQPMQSIDWERRFDHMQQHSGQHLITAIAMKQFNLMTTSWCLDPKISYIELDSSPISFETIDEMERVINAKIRENHSVTITFRDRNDLEDIFQRMELPDEIDQQQIRIISIESIDKNPCCGTHVRSLGDLQMIKLLGCQKSKKNKCLLYFLVGNRVLQHFNKMQRRIKQIQKNYNEAIKNLAKLEAQKYLNLSNFSRFYSLHRKEDNYDFISTFLNNIEASLLNERLILISILDDSDQSNGSGQIVLAGKIDLVQKASEIALNSFDVKGSISQQRFRGRIANVTKISELETSIRTAIEHIE
ncbi:alanyl-tRNA synthetase-like protein 2 [Sarcoptes scabiei]|uniref:Alanyl-tRNA synthetase-like protein 2 n=1 Tax=Sarcoptes scabiei TaxID=52283 RepID=A0A132AJ40_SARSC|nr:alanyl-tRNA synthetase-like protein 2 [Sarcoptes scabiei]